MWFFLASLAVLVGGGLLAWATGRNRAVASALGGTAALAGCGLALIDAVRVLHSGQAVGVSLAWQVPLGSLSLGLDPLSAVFVLAIAVVVGAAALYGFQYVGGAHSHVPAGSGWLFFNLLAATMLLVVAARNGLLFLMAWEGMSLASFFLVMSDHEQESVRRAGWTYLVAAHLGTACLLVAVPAAGRGTPTAWISTSWRPNRRWRACCSCWPWSGSAPRRVSCPSTCGCPRPIRRRRRTSRP